MKRNRLIRPSNRTSLFSDTANKIRNRRNLLILSALTFTAIFITSIVLATNKPATNTTQSQLIDLPGLSTEVQLNSLSTSQYSTTSTMSVAKQDVASSSSDLTSLSTSPLATNPFDYKNK
ncbi:MAG: hypothetical protein Q9N32_02690 [Gammaproteobacteria bacterium]|nr:hypothetical protein [Gammaproteobacteria bacterium]